MEISKKVYIGIDPDTEKSGVGLVYIKRNEDGTREIATAIDCLSFPELIEQLQAFKAHKDQVSIFVEAGWMEKKSNFHGKQGHVAEKIAKSVGANHQTGKHIIEMLQHWGIPVKAVHPLLKCWKGSDRKITHAELDRIVGGLPRKRTNQEERDALLLAWVFAELPIRC